MKQLVFQWCRLLCVMRNQGGEMIALVVGWSSVPSVPLVFSNERGQFLAQRADDPFEAESARLANVPPLHLPSPHQWTST